MTDPDHQEEVGLLLHNGNRNFIPRLSTLVSESSLDIKIMMLSRQVQQNLSEKKHRLLKKEGLGHNSR